MIELRYRIGSEPAPELGPNIGRSVKVLQYRQSQPPYTVGDTTYTTMTEWQDVPTVENV